MGNYDLDVSATVLGLDDLNQQLEKLVDLAQQEKYTYQAASYAITPIIKEAKRLAPRAEQAYYRYYRGSAKARRRGNPQNSRKLVQPGGLKKAIRRKRVKIDGSRGVAVQVRYGKAFYWRFLEYGTPRMAAVPFLRPAFDSQKMIALERFKDRYRRFVEAVVRRQLIDTGIIEDTE